MGDLPWAVSMAVTGVLVVFLGAGAIVTFGQAGNEESLGLGVWCMVLALATALLGRWWWGQYQVWQEFRSEK